MTLNEVTTLIASQLKKELDIPFKLMLAERIQVWRSRLFKNTLDKDAKERKFFRQTLYLPMIKTTDTPACTGFPGCDIAQTVDQLPNPLRANGILFDYVGSVDGTTPFKEVTAGFQAYANSGKYSKNVIPFTWDGRKIAVYSNPNLPFLRVDGIFDNPELAATLNCSNGQSSNCDFWETEYPVTGDIMQLIIQSIIQIDYGGRPITPDSKEVPVDTSKENQP